MNQWIINNLFVIYLTGCLLILLYFWKFINLFEEYIDNKLSIKRIKNFEKYETLISLYYDKAYSTIYKDHILVYSVEGLSPDEDDISKIQKLYLELLMELMGNGLINEYIEYYGDLNNLFKNAIIYFDNLYEDDTIKQNAISKQLNSNDT